MRAPSNSIQHSSTPEPSAGAKPDCGVELSRPAAITAKSSHSNSSQFWTTFPAPPDSIEMNIASVHFTWGAPAPRFFLTASHCHPERSNSFAPAKLLRSRRTPYPPAPPQASQGVSIPAQPLTPPPSASSLAASSAPASPYPHASPPAKTEAGTEPQYPAWN